MHRIVNVRTVCEPAVARPSWTEHGLAARHPTELSVRRRALANPTGVALRGPAGDMTWEEAARRVSTIVDAWRAEAGKRPAADDGRAPACVRPKEAVCGGASLGFTFSPLRLVARADERTVLTIWAALEAERPLVLLSGKLTARELAAQEKTIDSLEKAGIPLAPDTAVVMFTSGTTGRAKPAMISRAALIASARANAVNLPLTDTDVWQLAISPARIGGFSILTRALAAGAGIALAGSFTVEGFLASLRRDRVTVASVVPTMLAKILAEAPDAVPPAGFRAMLVGGASMSADLRRRAVSRGWPVMSTYGMTETASNVVTTPFAERFLVADSLGLPNAGVEIAVREGEVWVKGGMLATGYWGGALFEKNDWYPTGDLGEWGPDGRLRILARRTDLILSGGENVYPAEVEAALESIPGIRAARVVGLPDPIWGAIVTALVVTAIDGPSDAEIVAAVKTRLAAYKCPRRLARVGGLPLTEAGKPDRRPSVLEGLTLEVLHYKTH